MDWKVGTQRQYRIVAVYYRNMNSRFGHV